MYNIKDHVENALNEGFDHAGPLDLKALIFMPEVREMCSADRCHAYNKSWRCPPACGSIEDAAARVSKYSFGVIVQTVANMEDDFDYETIEAASNRHHENFLRLVENLRNTYDDVLPMGAGTCSLCEKCSYPDMPCRFPDKAISSMEAYGLWVSKVCELSGIPYYYGKQTITYTSCYLLP